MPYRFTPFITNNYYHLFNRGVEKRTIFLNDQDFQHFFQTLYYYQFSGPKPRFSTYRRFRVQDFDKNPKIVEINCYCLMPNHFHLLIKQLQEDGIKEFMQKLINSYTRYFNTKHNRVGHLFQGMFKAVPVETIEQLLHLSRYIHLNPYVSDLCKDLSDYPYSSYPGYIGQIENPLISSESILTFSKDSLKYKEFVSDHEGYAKELAVSKHLLFDLE